MMRGLLPLRKDERDLNLGAIIDLPKVVPDFLLDGGFAFGKIQEEDDCSAFAVSLARELRENIEIDRKFQFAITKSLTDSPESYGADLRDALKVPVKVGVLPSNLRPDACKDKPLSHLRYIANWPNVSNLMKSAWERRAKSYAFITPTQGMDAFDTIAATQYYWLLRGEKRAVVFGTFWQWNMSDYILSGWSPNGSGHAMTYLGKQTLNGVAYLVAQQNYGVFSGKNGIHLVSREIVNASQAIFGAGLFTSYTPDEVRTMMSNGYVLEKNVALSTIMALLRFCVDLLSQIKAKTYGIFTR